MDAYKGKKVVGYQTQCWRKIFNSLYINHCWNPIIQEVRQSLIIICKKQTKEMIKFEENL
ncbi:MAG: hypothetical protein GY870_06405 [archaeon]|nr:hypothetical protein [archaeon]